MNPIDASAPAQQPRPHGGPDCQGPAAYDFSVNSHAGGPCPQAQAAVVAADGSRYPDPGYTVLCERLAAFHGVAPERVLPAASASEFIFRISSVVAQRGGRSVWCPPHGYGDYAQAARAWGLAQAASPCTAALLWACEPSSPLGQAQPGLEEWLARAEPGAVFVLDRAYEPLRLEGSSSLDAERLEHVWQLWTPNKAMGLTGVRAAYAIAPASPEARGAIPAALEQCCPSWPIGAHGVALLTAWTQRESQDWLSASRCTLRAWKAAQWALCESLGWQCLPSQASFFCARPALPPGLMLAQALDGLRARGVRLRDASSFGLPGQVRVSVQPPLAQQALARAWRDLTGARA